MAKILVVDDRVSNREYLTTLLAYAGHTLLEAADGASALEKVRAERPDLVISDILMPTMDGFEFVQGLRKDPELAATKVIFHTATYSEPQALALAASCGVSVVLPKPSEPREVLDAVSRALGVDAPATPARSPKKRRPTAGGARQVIDDTLKLYTADLREAAVRRGQVKALKDHAAENVARLERVRSRLSALIEVGMEMDRERNPARLVEIFFGAACEIVQSDFAAIAMLDDERPVPRHVYTKGVDPLLYQDAGRARHGILATLLAKPRALRASSDDGSLTARSLPPQHPGVGSFLGMAIATDSQAYGWIYFANKAGRRGNFSAEDERLAAIMAAKLALLYDNLQLYDLVQRHAADLQIEMAKRERAEQQVQEAQASYRAVFQNSVAGIFVVNPDGRVMAANPALVRMLGYESAEELMTGISSVARQVYVEKGDRARFHELLRYQRAVEGFETRWRRKDGGVIWVSLSARMVDEQSIGHIGMAEDITQRKRSEEELQRFRLALDGSADMILITDRATMRHVDVNRAACELLGYTREELLRMGPPDILPVGREELEKAYDEMIANPTQPSGMRSYYRCKDGSRLPFESTRRMMRSGDQWLLVAISRDIRERLATDRALRESEAGLRRAQAMAKLGHVVTGRDGAFESWSDSLPHLVGLQSGQFPRNTRDWLGLLHPEDVPLFRAKATEAARTGARAKISYRLRRPDGAWIRVRQTMDPLRGEDDLEPRWFNTIQDVTEQREAEEKIERLNRVYGVLSGINTLIVRVRDREELFREASRVAVETGGFRMAWIGVVDHEAGIVRPAAMAGEVGDFFDNAPLAVTENKPGGHGLAGRAVRERTPVVSNDIRNDPQRLMKKELEARGINSVALLPLIVGGDAMGVVALYAGEVGFFDEEEMKLLIELAGDISFALDHLLKTEKINYLAYYDELTGLANRTLFAERLEQTMRDARSSGHMLALSILDIERFKAVNDAFGRENGDLLLREIAARMKAAGKEPARMARLGADHFAVMSQLLQNEDEVARVTEQRLQQIFEAPFSIAGQEFKVSARIGIAIFPQDGGDSEALLRSAEAAVKSAKASGERYLFYTREMTERVAGKLALETRLRRALDDDEFVLHYQPKVDLASNAIVGVEALLRWQSPEKGLVPPLQFIPLLEETGLILPVGAWALRRAALDHRSWVERKLKAPRVAVNVSAFQLRQRDFVATVERAILDGMAPTAIDLEITESLVMADIKGNIEKLKAVRALGVNVAIDDFGTGYSSLAYLAQLPVQALKIDRSFIIRMQEDPNAMTLVSTMISLAHSLRLKVIAEGVETEDQAKFLRLLRCDQMQGYLFSKPLPAEQLVELLQR